MLEKAITKIKLEMEKEKKPYVTIIGKYLIDLLEKDYEVAEKILVENKTILKSLDEMKKVAMKQKVGNCAVLTDEEGFGIVLKYFGIAPQGSKKENKKSALEDIKLENFM